MDKVVIRLRISADMAEWMRNYSRSKGISLNRSISNAIENEMMRKQKRRLKHI